MGSISEGKTILAHYMTPERLALLHKNIEQRTRRIAVILEDIHKPQNASAILRTCDCMGIQDVHLAENKHQYSPNKRIVRGADKWLTIHAYNAGESSTKDAISHLQSTGYRVLAACPHKTAYSIEDVDVEASKIALLFGTEREGISVDARRYADGFVSVPMYGFSESYNVSVTVALALQPLRRKLEASAIPWRLADAEKEQLLFDWYKKSVRSADELLRYHRANPLPTGQEPIRQTHNNKISLHA